MTTRALGPGAGWGWLKQAINLGRHNPKAIFGAVALLAVVALIPSVIQLCLQYGAGLDPQTIIAVVGAMTLVMIVLYPLLIGGLLRVIDASENGRPTHATALFDTFKAGNGAGRLIGFGVLITVIYIAAFVAVIGLFGKDFLAWYMQLISTGMQTGASAPPPAITSLPEGFGTVMALGILVGLFFFGVYAIGFGQVALGGRGIGAALGDGAVGTLKNLLPILVLAVIAIVLLLAFTLVVGLLGALLALVGGLVHDVFAFVLLIPLYLGMLLVLYVVMFGVMYFMWREICGGSAAAPTAPVTAGNQVEL